VKRRAAKITAVCALVTLLAGARAPTAWAGSIGFRTDAEVTAGPGVDAKVTLTQTGDESAEAVSVSAELLGRTIEGDPVARVAPGQNHVWNFHLLDEIAKGVYAIALRARYTDANGYPFEVVSVAAATVRVTPAPRVFGSIEVPGVAVGGQSTAKLTAKRPPQRSGKFIARLVAPSGLEVKPERLELEFNEGGKATAHFQVRNLKLLAGTSVNIFAFIEGSDAGFPQTDTIRGTVSIGAAVSRSAKPRFYEAAAAVLILLALLEGLGWIAARRRSSE